MASVALHTKDHRDLLEVIDSLRSQGISRYVDLPEIIVCGDQTSGKSSVLESISGISFPTRDNLCTRFPTEICLRRNPTPAVKISITPGPDRSPEDRDRLLQFRPDVDSKMPGLSVIIEKARAVMGLSDTKVFSRDVLRVEVSGPTQPHLTLVDLPGLIRAENGSQSLEDAATVRKLVRSYMKRPRSIILTVVAANTNFSHQEVIGMARRMDPSGTRTMGIITKPDKLDAGSEVETAYLRLAQNKEIVFRLGWHVLKNRSFEMRDASSQERDEAEAGFFAKGVWTLVDPACLGAQALKPRLSRALKEQILRQLPSLLADVECGITECHGRLERLGAPRTTLEDQRRYMMRVSKDFSFLMKAAIEGFYADPFFGSGKTEDGYTKRLRAVVQNTLADFENEMVRYGQSRVITEEDEDEMNTTASMDSHRQHVSRARYIEEVVDLMHRSRGCELAGTFNPLIIGELFTEQCQPWREIAMRAKENVVQVVYQTVQTVLDHVASEKTTDGIFQIVNRHIEKLSANLDDKVNELLSPHSSSHPITFNKAVTEDVQRAQFERRRRNLEKSLRGLSDGLDANQVDPAELLNTLLASEVSMEKHASELAVDYMEAYYKVAVKKFIDDLSVLAVENCLIKKLATLWTPDLAYSITDEELSRVAGESDETTARRTRYTEKLAVLENGLRELKRLDKYRTIPEYLLARNLKNRLVRARSTGSQSRRSAVRANEDLDSELGGSQWRVRSPTEVPDHVQSWLRDDRSRASDARTERMAEAASVDLPE